MKKLIKHFAFLVVLLTMTDMIVGELFDRIMDIMPNTTSQTAHTNWNMKSVDSDVIILGSSRAAHHYIPSIISDSLNLTVYNCGQEGMDVIYNSCCLDRIISRKYPKVIILDMDESYYQGGGKQRISCLNPYYKDSRMIKSALEEVGDKYTKYKMISNLYRFNGKLFNIASAFLSPRDTNNGYLPLYGAMADKSTIVNNVNYAENADPMVYDYFVNIVNICNDTKIKLVVVNSPIYLRNKYYFQFTQKYCESRGVYFLNTGTDTKYLNNSKLFWDVTHLNHDGAIVFSSQIAYFIKLKVLQIN